MRFAARIGAACLLAGLGTAGGATQAQPAGAVAPRDVADRVAHATWQFQQKDYAAAFAAFSVIAAETDNPNAETMLGLIYQYGLGAPKDYAQAAQWYQKAAEQGGAEAQIRLGLLYFNGTGVTKNKVEAYRLLTLGLRRIDPEPKAFRDNAQKVLDDISGALTLEQQNKANVQARQTRYRGNLGPQS